MGLVAWIKERLSTGEVTETEIDFCDLFERFSAEAYARELAFHSAVNLIANSITKCEFRTFRENEEVNDQEHYLWNVQPNPNQNAVEFMRALIGRLYFANECLVVEHRGGLFIADSYQKTSPGVNETVYSDVIVGDHTFQRSFRRSDVMYFKLNNVDVRRIIRGLYDSYGELLSFSMNAYRLMRGRRGILNISTQAQGAKTFQETFSKLMNERFRDFFTAPNAVLPLFEGYSYDEKNERTYSSENTRDSKAIIDDAFDFVGRGLSVPSVLLKGDVANIGEAVDSFLTFCIDPLADFLKKEINRARYGPDAMRAGSYMMIDTHNVKHADLFSVSGAIDKLTGSGFSHNQILRRLGQPTIDEEWANTHHVTRNYMDVQDASEEGNK